jgi:hypothetical protein
VNPYILGVWTGARGEICVTTITIAVGIRLGSGVFSGIEGVDVMTTGGRGVEVMMIGVEEDAGMIKLKI